MELLVFKNTQKLRTLKLLLDNEMEWSLSFGKQKDQIEAEGLMIKQSIEKQKVQIIEPKDQLVEDVVQALGII